MYKFSRIPDIKNFVINSIGTNLLIPSDDNNKLVFFQNGDKMTIDCLGNNLLWEPISQGDMFSSKLSLRLHQWFGKGIIYLEK